MGRGFCRSIRKNCPSFIFNRQLFDSVIYCAHIRSNRNWNWFDCGEEEGCQTSLKCVEKLMMISFDWNGLQIRLHSVKAKEREHNWSAIEISVNHTSQLTFIQQIKKGGTH